MSLPRYTDQATDRRWTATLSTRALEHELDNLADLERHGLLIRQDHARRGDIRRELARRAQEVAA
jgi:hypothetical protein